MFHLFVEYIYRQNKHFIKRASFVLSLSGDSFVGHCDPEFISNNNISVS